VGRLAGRAYWLSQIHTEILLKFLQIKHMKLTSKFQHNVFREANFLLLFAAIAISGCAPTISQFNETAYQQAVQLKVQSLVLVNKATEPYADHADIAETLRQDLETAYEYAKGRPDNELSTRQWEIMIDPERNLMGGLLKRWEEEGTLSPVFVREFRGVISDAFDTIIGLESGKIKPEEVQ
jgi:hypothetical protein